MFYSGYMSCSESWCMVFGGNWLVFATISMRLQDLLLLRRSMTLGKLAIVALQT